MTDEKEKMNSTSKTSTKAKRDLLRATLPADCCATQTFTEDGNIDYIIDGLSGYTQTHKVTPYRVHWYG